jgi:hypothetical protein
MPPRSRLSPLSYQLISRVPTAHAPQPGAKRSRLYGHDSSCPLGLIVPTESYYRPVAFFAQLPPNKSPISELLWHPY